MYNLGHKGITLILYSPLLLGLLILEYFLLAPLGLLISLTLYSIPDKDIKMRKVQSAFNEKLPLINLKNYVEFLFITHRGITHTVWFAGLIGLLFGVFAYLLPETVLTIFFAPMPIPIYAIGFFGLFGVLSHFAGDIITPRGIKPFAPLYNRRFTISLVSADNETWNGRFYWLGSKCIILTISFWVLTQLVMFQYGFGTYPELGYACIDLLKTISEQYL